MTLRAAAASALFAPAAIFFLGTACAGKGSPPPAATAEEESQVNADIVSATAIVARCPDGSQMNAKAAQQAIQRLVSPCAMVPGGNAHFSATLFPGGRLELGSPEGNPAEGVVPTCVLKDKRSHNVNLKSPCMFDVTLEERKVKMGGFSSDAGAQG